MSLSDLALATNNMTSAHDSRAALFNQLKSLTLPDDERQKLINHYAIMSKQFEDARKKVLDLAKKEPNP